MGLYIRNEISSINMMLINILMSYTYTEYFKIILKTTQIRPCNYIDNSYNDEDN